MRRILPPLLSVLALAFPGLAGAAVRTISFDDPNDAPPALSGPQDEDVRSAMISYDDTSGTITFTVAFYGSLNGSRHPDDLSIGATLTGGVSDFSDGCSVLASPWATAFVMPKNSSASLSLYGATGTVAGSVALSGDGASFTATWSHAALANQNFRCAEADDLRWHYYEYSYCRLSGCPRTSTVLDSMPPGRWFTGLAPACDDGVDNDDDGTIDTKDATCTSKLGQTEGAPNTAPTVSSLRAAVTGKGRARTLNGKLVVCDDRGGVRVSVHQHKTALASSPARVSNVVSVAKSGCTTVRFKRKLLWPASMRILITAEARDSRGLTATNTRAVSVPRG